MNQNEYNTFQNSVFPKITRAGTAKRYTEKKPYIGEGRDAKIDQDLYYRLKEENEQMKKTKLSNNKKIVKLQTELANLKESILKERKMAGYSGINMGKDYDFNLENMKYQNEKLKSENDKKDLLIKGLQSNYSPNKAKSNKKNKSKNKDPLISQSVKNEYLALISRLRGQLKIAHEDNRNLINELKVLKENQNKKDYSEPFNDNLRQKRDREMAGKLADMTSNYENANVELATQNRVLELTKKAMEDYRDQYERERENNRKLQTELSLLRGDSEKIANYKKQLDEARENERKLDEELSRLRISPFRDAEERGNVYRNYQISEKNLSEAKKKLSENEKALSETELRLRELEKENKQLKDSLSVEKVDKEKFKEEALKLKISRIEREKSDKLFQDKLNQFSQYGEIDSNFVKILSLYKNQNDELNWGNINFIEPELEKNNDPIYLKNEIKRLRIEKNSLGKELENTKNLLLIQQQVNDDNKKLQEYEIEKFKGENKMLKQKIDDLCKLIDMKKLPQEYYTTSLKETNKYATSPIPMGQKSQSGNVPDNLTELSQEDTEVELAVNENALDIYFGECVYEEGITDEVGYDDLDNMLSFFSVDFYVHETQTSDILSGKNPMFNFQVIFKVIVNESLLNYLENDFVELEIYSIRDNIQMKFGKGQVSLKELMEVENMNNPSRVINSECPIFSDKNPNLKVATIHYKMCMRKPLSEALKWYHEQNQLINEREPAHESLMSKAEQSMKEYKNLGGKAYEIKILIKKAADLIITGPARRIAPYFYYKFYKNGERYSQVSQGNNPEFEDIATFHAIYNKEFLDYIETDNLNVYLFDSMNPIELDVSEEDVAKLVNSNQQLSKDLIGICRIPLQGLLVNDLIQGEFPIYNMKDQRVGKLILNIFWEEINMKSNEAFMSGSQNEFDIYQDNLIFKLANALKEKKLTIESAFSLFDIDNRNEITLDNFKNILLFTLKFTTNQYEMEHLIKLLFTNQGKNKLDKADFYKIFSKLLPIDDHTYKSQYNNTNLNNLSNTTQNIDNSNIGSKYPVEQNKDKDKDKDKDKGEVTLSINPPYMSTNQLNNTQTEINNKEKDGNNATISSAGSNSRSFNDIGQLMAKYKLRKGKSFDAVDLFKDIFDRDASLGIDKKELHVGFEKMGIILTEGELNKLWKNMSNKGEIDFASFKKFHDNYCLPFQQQNKSNNNTMRSVNDNNNVSQSGQNFTEYHG